MIKFFVILDAWIQTKFNIIVRFLFLGLLSRVRIPFFIRKTVASLKRVTLIFTTSKAKVILIAHHSE